MADIKGFKIKGQTYTIAPGTEVIANPEITGNEDTLISIGIDETNYILSGGSGGSTVEILNQYTKNWSTKTWSGLTSFRGNYIWTDGENIYYSRGTTQKVLNKDSSTGESKTWSGLTNFDGNNIWVYNNNIYYSSGSTQKVLDKATSTWSNKTGSGLTDFYGYCVWNDGTTVYYDYAVQANNGAHYKYDPILDTWVPTDLTSTEWINLLGEYVWTDGANIYYDGLNYITYNVNQPTIHLVLDRTSLTWRLSGKNDGIYANSLGKCGNDLYNSITQKLNKITSVGEAVTFTGISASSLQAQYIGTDGHNIYYSNNDNQYVLDTVTSQATTLSKLAETGKYSDLIDAPAISNSKVTLTIDGNDQGSFTLNQPDSVTIELADVAVPNQVATDSGAQTVDLYCVKANNTTFMVPSKHISSVQTNYAVIGSGSWINLPSNYFSYGPNLDVTGILNSFDPKCIGTDGINIYYSNNYTQLKLDKSCHQGNRMSWNISELNGYNIWRNARGIFYSHGEAQYILRAPGTGVPITWNGDVTNFFGNQIWSDGFNIYLSATAGLASGNFRLSGLYDLRWIQVSLPYEHDNDIAGNLIFNGYDVWSDGVDTYLNDRYKFDKNRHEWRYTGWNSPVGLSGYTMWTDGYDIYNSSNGSSYKLNRATHSWVSVSYNYYFSGAEVGTDGDHLYVNLDSIYTTTNNIKAKGSFGEAIGANNSITKYADIKIFSTLEFSQQMLDRNATVTLDLAPLVGLLDSPAVLNEPFYLTDKFLNAENQDDIVILCICPKVNQSSANIDGLLTIKLEHIEGEENFDATIFFNGNSVGHSATFRPFGDGDPDVTYSTFFNRLISEIQFTVDEDPANAIKFELPNAFAGDTIPENNLFQNYVVEYRHAINSYTCTRIKEIHYFIDPLIVNFPDSGSDSGSDY